MFEKILLPTDFSTDSQKVLGYVKDIPGAREVFLLHVADATHPSGKGLDHGTAIRNAEILLEENRQILEKEGLKARAEIETIVNPLTRGNVPLMILEKAGTGNVSLIMMGARGKNTIQDILLGSVSAGVIRHARTPVILMRFPPGSPTGEGRRHLFSRILVPVDFSEPSSKTLSFLKGIPAIQQVILLNVVDTGESEPEIQELVRAAREQLEIIRKDLAGSGINAEAQVHVGYPPDEISATADRNDVTLILISPQGEGWMRELRTLFIGSTTSAVIRRAHRPVLIAAGQISR